MAALVFQQCPQSRGVELWEGAFSRLPGQIHLPVPLYTFFPPIRSSLMDDCPVSKGGRLRFVAEEVAGIGLGCVVDLAVNHYKIVRNTTVCYPIGILGLTIDERANALINGRCAKLQIICMVVVNKNSGEVQFFFCAKHSQASRTH